MKRNLAPLISLFAGLFIFSAATQAEPQKLTLDSNHTYVMWSIGHLGFSNQTGKWYATGQLTVDPSSPEQSKVDVSIDLANIVTGIPELDKHLKSNLFFDVAKYPKATFVSNKVNVLSKNTADVSGMLTLHGVSKPVVLHVTMNKQGVNPISDKMTVGFTATAVIKRSDFGINTLLPSLGDTVDLTIGAEAYQDKKEG